jgi:hypothetical protein
LARLRNAGVKPWMLILGGIVLLALALRLWGIKYGMPFAYQIDEERIYVRKAARMLHAHSINPHYQHNPPLFTYLLELIYLIKYGTSGAYNLLGAVPGRETLWEIGRVCSALIGTVGVWLTFVVGRRFFDRRTGLVAAFLMAVAFLPVFYSHVALNNVPAMAAGMVGLLGAAGVMKRGARRDYVVAGIGVGLAAATKYLDGIVLLPVICAALVAPDPGEGRARWRELALTGAVALGCFVVLNPTALLLPGHFIGALGAQESVVGQHKYGQSSSGALDTYLRTFTWGLGWVPAIGALLGAGLLLREDRRKAAVLLPVVPLFILYMSLQSRYFGRWMLPLFPIAILLAAYAGVRIAELAAGWLRRPALVPALAVTAALALGAQALVHSFHDDQVLSRPHTQNLARNWMLEHVPKGTKIVSEPLRADAWDSYWEGRRSPTWFLTGGQNPLAGAYTAVNAILTGEHTGPTGQSAFARYLSPRLVGAYIQQDFCWIVTSSNYWGLTLSDPKVADRAASYYRALKRHGYVAFSASPWGDVDSPGGPGHDKVPFDYDFTYDFYPLSYTRPGPYVQVYRLTDGRCNPALQRRRATSRTPS